MTTNTTTPRERTLFGHPIGLTYLFTTEMAERFSYYGMTAILILYLSKQLLIGSNPQHVLFYGPVKGAFEAVLGHMTPNAFAAQITGLYTGLAYFTPFFGGLLADRLVGQRYSVLVGGLVMAAGEFMLTQDALFFPGLLALIVGNGGFKPNISTQVGNLYAPGDPRIDRAFSIFYVGINIGATLSPLICGTLGEEVGWHWGFFAAGVGVSLGVLVYAMALPLLPPDRITRARRSGETVEHTPLTATEWRSVGAIVLLCLPVAAFWTSYAQQYITILLWADNNTDRRFIPGLLNVVIPATWSQLINPAMIFTFTPFVVWLWASQAKRGKEPSTVSKMAFGCLLQAISYVVMAGVAAITGLHAQASWLWLLLFFAFYTMGELYVSPVGLSLVSRVAPPQVLSAMMGFWFISVFVGNYLAGFQGIFWDRVDKSVFFVVTATISLGAALALFVLERPLRPILEIRVRGGIQPGPDYATEEHSLT